LVTEGGFRQDLLYRLNTFVITLPPLRERLADMALLTVNFINKFCKKYQKDPITLSDSALTKLNRHNWPGNIRELSHVIERAVLMATSNEITDLQLLLEVPQNEQNHIVLQPLEVAEQQLIDKAMTVTQGNVIEAAKILDISRNALYRRLEKFANNENISKE
jgi:transcriptional regulator with PAS, ATPase and Fis domain